MLGSRFASSGRIQNWRNRIGSVAEPFALGMERARSERHPLDAAGLELPAVARASRRARSVPFDDVGQPLDVGVRVHRPVGAGDEPVVVEDAERAEPVCSGRGTVEARSASARRTNRPAPGGCLRRGGSQASAPPLAARPGPRYSGSFQAVRSQSSTASACGRNVGSSISTLPAKT